MLIDALDPILAKTQTMIYGILQTPDGVTTLAKDYINNQIEIEVLKNKVLSLQAELYECFKNNQNKTGDNNG